MGWSFREDIKDVKGIGLMMGLREITRICAKLRESAQDHHEADALDVLDILTKTPGLYLVPELRYPYHCCRRPYRCPPPRRHPPNCHHHHKANALEVLDVLAKIPCLYLVPELRYPCHCCHRPCRCPPPRRRPPHHRHHHHHLGSWGNTRGGG